MSENRLVLTVNSANLRQNHLYIDHRFDFFPPECFGPSRKMSASGNGQIEIHLEGLNETIQTDIGTDKRTGKPRNFFRRRGWVKRFYKHHHVNAGDELALDRLGAREYRLSIGPGTGRRPTAAEFFSGIGLVRLALERQGWEVVFANDIDKDKAEMYRHNWPENDHLVEGDIHKLNARDIPTCDLFTASFPCNDLSIAGRWEGLNGKQSSAYWGFIDIIREMGRRRPKLVLLENVVGFLQRHKGRDFELAMLALNDLGYAVDAVILNAVHWVPQSRARLFVIAKSEKGRKHTSFAMASDARPRVLTEFIAAHQGIVWDLQELPALPKSRRSLADILEDLADDDPHWWNKQRTDYFMNQLSERHAAEAKQMIVADAISYATAFRRVRNDKSMAELRTDGIAGCLRTPRGGSARQIVVKAGRGKCQVRLLLPRECARLQGVPNSYKIRVPANQSLFGFGDAVCVPVVRWIAKEYLTPISSFPQRVTL
jgi:DNA (cytosine-5)-methyltransferase 1